MMMTRSRSFNRSYSLTSRSTALSLYGTLAPDPSCSSDDQRVQAGRPQPNQSPYNGTTSIHSPFPTPRHPPFHPLPHPRHPPSIMVATGLRPPAKRHGARDNLGESASDRSVHLPLSRHPPRVPQRPPRLEMGQRGCRIRSDCRPIVREIKPLGRRILMSGRYSTLLPLALSTRQSLNRTCTTRSDFSTSGSRRN